MPKLSVITPCMRPHNLPTIALHLSLIHEFEVTWCIGYDRGIALRPNLDNYYKLMTIVEWERNHEGDWGNPQRNEGLEWMGYGPTSWVWFLDDDNLPHEDFGHKLAEVIRTYPDKKGFVFSQLGDAGTIRLKASANAQSGQIDSAQMVFDRDWIGVNRWRPTGYDADFHFFRAVVMGRVDQVKFLADAAVYYNALRLK